MRWAALLLAVLGCGPDYAVYVTVTPSNVSAVYAETECACDTSRLSLDECKTWSDVRMSCPCAENVCRDFTFDMAAQTATLDGCGIQATFALPALPATPTFDVKRAGVYLDVTWHVDDRTESVRLHTDGGFGGYLCRPRVEVGHLAMNSMAFVAAVAVGRTVRVDGLTADLLITPESEYTQAKPSLAP